MHKQQTTHVFKFVHACTSYKENHIKKNRYKQKREERQEETYTHEHIHFTLFRCLRVLLVGTQMN